MLPIVNGLEEEFSGELTVLRLDAAEPENTRLMQEYGLRSHPSFVALDKNGRVIQAFVGPQSEEVLRAVIQVLIS